MATSNINYKLLLWILAMLGVLGTAYSSVLAWPAASVGLTRFAAMPLDNAVRLEWDTETELETAGFRLKRGQDQGFDYLVEPGTNSSLFISSQGGPATGATYTFTDETAVNGESYIYQLVEVEVSGSEIVQAESAVLVGLVPTDTPIVLNSGGSGDEEVSVPATESATPTEAATTSPLQATPTTAVTRAATVSPARSLMATATPIPDNVAEPATAVAVSGETQPTAVLKVRETSVDSGPRSAAALAQENPEGYPVEEPTAVSPPDANDQQEVEISPGAEVTVQPGDSSENPTIIGATPYPIDTAVPAANPDLQNGDSSPSPSIFAGQVYLWVGFLAALVIFGAAVLGAILLYTRRRSKE